MIALDNPLPPIVGITLMGLCCQGLSKWFPLLVVESHAHASSLPLDGLRGILASSVFFHHAYITYVYMQTGQWTTPASNFYGQLGPTAVTMFFFISGYLFWGKMLKNPASLRPARLWPNRVRRIIPGYWASIGAALLIIGVVSGFRLHQPLFKRGEIALQLLAVGFPWQPDVDGLTQVTGGVYWTLRMEMLFYLLLPAMVWFRRSWKVLILFAAAAGLDYAASQVHSHHGSVVGMMGLFRQLMQSILYGFSFGMVAAYQPWKLSPRIASWLKSPRAVAIAVALLVGQFGWIPAGYTWYEPLLLVPVFFMVAAGNNFFGALTSRAMRCLGQVSYSVYIFHMLILFLLTRIWNRITPIAGLPPTAYWMLILGIGMVVATLCTLTYWFIERPFLSRRMLDTTRAVQSAAAPV